MMRLALLLLAATTLAHAERRTTSRTAALFDVSAPLSAMEQFIPDKLVTIHPAGLSTPVHQGPRRGPGVGLGSAPPNLPPDRPGRGGRGGRGPANTAAPRIVAPPAPEIGSAGAAVEQTSQGSRPSIPPVAAFDGLGEGFRGMTEVAGAGRGGIDISLAVGPDHIVEILNGNMAVYTKKGKRYATTGKLLYGAVPNNTVFTDFGVRCGVSNNADSVVRYDQLANRWLIVVPVFTRPPGNPQGPYAMCYAVSATPDPLGAYYRYEFERPLFPDYPRPRCGPTATTARPAQATTCCRRSSRRNTTALPTGAAC